MNQMIPVILMSQKMRVMNNLIVEQISTSQK